MFKTGIHALISLYYIVLAARNMCTAGPREGEQQEVEREIRQQGRKFINFKKT